MTVAYVPHAAQRDFHDDRFVYHFRAMFAGTGAGKTYMGAQEALSLAWAMAGSVGLVCEPTYKKISEVVIPTFKQILGKDYSTIITRHDKSKSYLDICNGSRIWMIGLDKPEAAEGMNVDWAWLDEARLVPKLKEAMESVMRRLRGTGMWTDHPDEPVPDNWTCMYITTTPDYPGSVLNRYFEGKKKLVNSHVYRMSVMDNPTLPKHYIDNVKNTHEGSGKYDRFVLGKFAAAGGVAFEYDYTIHTQGFTPPHKVESSIRYGVDFGWTNPSAILSIQTDSDGRAYVVEEVYGRQLSMEVLSNHLLRLYDDHGRGPVICDRSRPDNIQEFVNAGIDARPDKSKRDDGIADLGGRFQIQGDDLPRIYISSECENLIDEIQTYDPNLKVHDHAVDGLRYALADLLAMTPPYTGAKPPMIFNVGTRSRRR